MRLRALATVGAFDHFLFYFVLFLVVSFRNVKFYSYFVHRVHLQCAFISLCRGYCTYRNAVKISLNTEKYKKKKKRETGKMCIHRSIAFSVYIEQHSTEFTKKKCSFAHTQNVFIACVCMFYKVNAAHHSSGWFS